MPKMPNYKSLRKSLLNPNSRFDSIDSIHSLLDPGSEYRFDRTIESTDPRSFAPFTIMLDDIAPHVRKFMQSREIRDNVTRTDGKEAASRPSSTTLSI